MTATIEQLIALDAIRGAAQTVLTQEAVVRASLVGTPPPPPPPADTAAPVMAGSLTVSALTTTGYSLTWPAATDNVGVVSYERSIDGGLAWLNVGPALSASVSGRTPGTVDQVRVRAFDAAGNVSAALATAVTLQSVAPPPPPPGADTITWTRGASSDITRAPLSTPGQMVGLILHGSGGGPIPEPDKAGDWFEADCSGNLIYAPGPQSKFYLAATNYGDNPIFFLRPNDRQQAGTGPWQQSEWAGYVGPDGKLDLVQYRRLLRMIDDLPTLYPQANPLALGVSGNSMGAWGGARLAVHNPSRIAYALLWQPRWKSASTIGLVEFAQWGNGWVRVPFAQAPTLSDADGGGSSLAHFDCLAVINDPTKDVPWLGWAIGANDQYVPWADTRAAIAACRAAKRPFACAWNQGDHGTPPSMEILQQSYTRDLFRIGRGMPYLSGSSRDADPDTALEGDINRGFIWRNIVETATSWSCQLTNQRGATTVTVEPSSKIFPRGVRSASPVAPKTVSLPGGEAWVTVSFTA